MNNKQQTTNNEPQTANFYVLGVDGGGTKTIAVVADYNGNIVGSAISGGSNFQSYGVKQAEKVVNEVITNSLSRAGVNRNEIISAVFGLAGADRPRDFQFIDQFIRRVTPTKNYKLLNDANIILRLGTPDSVGIALIAGTGTNAVGINNNGEEVHSSGLGWGDDVGGDSIGSLAVGAAFRAVDGRGEKTVLEEMIKKKFKLKNVADLIEFGYYDSKRKAEFQPWMLSPMVFESAAKGDKVAKNILQYEGKELSLSAVTIIKKLFKKNEHIKIVLAGSILQKPKDKTIIETLKKEIRKRHKNFELIVTRFEPVFGALFCAYDLAKVKVTDDVSNNLTKTWLNKKIK